jgi:hypothetical protein
MITKKIKKDTELNYSVSFTPEAKAFYYKKKITRIKNQLVLKDPFFNQNKYAAHIAELELNGFTIIKNFFKKNQIKNISERVDKYISLGKNLEGVRDNKREFTEKRKFFDRIWLSTEQIKSLSYNELKQKTNGITIANPLVTFPEFVTMFAQEKFMQVLYNYYECIPKLTYIKIRKAFANTLPANDTQFFHRDSGSYKLLKALIYLNDVDINTGPFTYVQKSHLKFDFPSKKLRFTDKEISKFYGKKNIKYLTAKKGDLVIANTTAFHKGLKPKKNDRNVCIANFCLHEEIGFSYKKINVKFQDYKKLSSVQKVLFESLKKI